MKLVRRNPGDRPEEAIIGLSGNVVFHVPPGERRPRTIVCAGDSIASAEYEALHQQLLKEGFIPAIIEANKLGVGAKVGRRISLDDD